MRLISWNVNGLRAVMKKGFEDIFWNLNADFFCLQETKLQAGQIDLDRRAEGLFRHRHLYQTYAAVRQLQHRHP